MKKIITLFLIFILLSTTFVFASCERKHTVTFAYADGTQILQTTVARGDFLQLPQNPTCPTDENKVFSGWCIDAELTQYFDYYTKITSNTVLYAKFIDISPDTSFRWYLLEDDTYAVSDFVGDETEAAIPSEYNGKKVTRISSAAFNNCYHVTNIVLPDSLITIGRNAFSSCSIKNINIPALVAYIDENAFNRYMTFFSVDADNANFKSIDGNLYSKDETTLVQYAIGRTEETFTVPECVTDIGRNAFSLCESLIQVNLSSTVINIGNYAFNECTNLITVKMNEGVTNIGNYAFSQCENLIEIKIPNSVIDIGYDAFSRCKKLTEIVIPNSVKNIGNSAFSNCNLSEIVIPRSVQYIGIRVFAGCSSLKNIEVDINNKCYKSVDGSLFSKDGKSLITYSPAKLNTEYIIPYGVTVIENGAFGGSRNLINVTIPDSVVTIEDFAFGSCENILNINIPSSVTYIGEYAFDACENLANIELSENIEYLGRDAFRYCANLIYSYKDNVKYLGNTEVPYLAAIDVIDNTAQNIVLQNTTKVIYNETFENCANLTNLVFPDSVTYIGYDAFWGCDNLTNISMSNNIKIMDDPFDIFGDNIAYNIVENIKYLGNEENPYVVAIGVVDRSVQNLVIQDTVKLIYDSAFAYCTNITNIIIPNSVTIIADDVFRGCTNLIDVTLSVNLTYLGRTVFYDCVSLTNITLPQGITIIRNFLFGHCGNLTSVEFEGEITYIEQSAFSGCDKLTKILIPISVTKMGADVFYRCYNLTIFCEAESAPLGWKTNWNSTDCPVVWGYTGE